MHFSLRRWLMLVGGLLLLAGCSAGGTGSAQPTITPPPTAESNLPSRATTAPASPTEAADQPTALATAADQPTAAPATDTPLFSRLLLLADPRLVGDDVKAVQQRLIDLGYLASDGADGIFGPRTQASVELFQAINVLEQDGVVGEGTWELLFSDQAQSIIEDLPPPAGRILFIKPEGSEGATLASVNPDGSDEQPIEIFLGESERIISLVANPSGSYLAYTAGVGGIEDISLYIARNDGTLISSYGGMSNPRFSPDGSRFIANVLSESGDPLLIVYDTEREDEAGPLANLPGYAADWSADGSTIIFVTDSDIFTYNLDSGETTQITELPSEGENVWYIDEAHLSPDGSRIYFYAGQSQNLGASGNGMQWWVIPSAGGSAGCSQRFEGRGDPVAFTDIGGNGVGDFAFNVSGDVLAYTEGAHVSACSSIENIYTRTTNDQESPVAAFTEFQDNGGQYIQGLSWDASGTQLAFGFQRYFCEVQEGQDFIDFPVIYAWNIAEGGEPERIANGSWPIWVQFP